MEICFFFSERLLKVSAIILFFFFLFIYFADVLRGGCCPSACLLMMGETWFNTIRDAKLDGLNKGADVTKSQGWPRSRSSAWLKAMNSALTSALHPQEVAEGVGCVSCSRWVLKHQVCFFPSRKNNLHSALRCHFYISEIVQCCLLLNLKI